MPPAQADESNAQEKETGVHVAANQVTLFHSYAPGKHSSCKLVCNEHNLCLKQTGSELLGTVDPEPLSLWPFRACWLMTYPQPVISKPP